VLITALGSWEKTVFHGHRVLLVLTGRGILFYFVLFNAVLHFVLRSILFYFILRILFYFVLFNAVFHFVLRSILFYFILRILFYLVSFLFYFLFLFILFYFISLFYFIYSILCYFIYLILRYLILFEGASPALWCVPICSRQALGGASSGVQNFQREGGGAHHASVVHAHRQRRGCLSLGPIATPIETPTYTSNKQK
jgi:hypothetical protein